MAGNILDRIPYLKRLGGHGGRYVDMKTVYDDEEDVYHIHIISEMGEPYYYVCPRCKRFHKMDYVRLPCNKKCKVVFFKDEAHTM